MNSDTIAAIATPPGFGGVGIVRLSGSDAARIATAICSSLGKPREAAFRVFRDAETQPIDEGLVLFFPAPDSFTGEHVVELHAHGGPVVMDMLLQRCVALGARLARPGEFSERAFLNDKLDLVQAEAIADLIESGSTQAARMATRSLRGEFSRQVHALVEELTALRVYVEAALDFPDEDIDFLSDGRVEQQLAELLQKIESLRLGADQGRVMHEGLTLVIAGLPNAGKSSLLNLLARNDAAIVTDIPGTTRDLLREFIQIDGLPVHLIDTAGLRDSDNPIEQEGIRRARKALDEADLVLWVYDCQADSPRIDAKVQALDIPLLLIRNKIDRCDEPPGRREHGAVAEIALSAKRGDGLDALHAFLKQHAGVSDLAEGSFSARRRHLVAIDKAEQALNRATNTMLESRAGELVAADLLYAQRMLGEITGEVSADDLLGEIFSSFCIGK